MRYEKQILEAYAKLGFQPRDKQAAQCDEIVRAFLDEGNRTVVLSAPTGTGKSIIGAVTAEVIHSIKYPDSEHGASFLLTATNVLADQYSYTFDGIEGFHIIKGARNYACKALSTVQEPVDAESCAIQLFRKQNMRDMMDTYCSQCEYQKSREAKSKSRHLITNYSFYFIDRLYAQHPIARRSICVFDEAHLVNDLFVEHNSVYVSEKRLKITADEAMEHLQLGHSDLFTSLRKIKDNLAAGKITDKNYQTYARALLECYEMISNSARAKAESNIRNHGKYLQLSRLSKKYYNLGCKIDDLLRFQYPHVFEYKPKDLQKGQNEHEMSIKPIFVGEMFQALDNADYNLLMSATISEGLTKRTMMLPEPIKHICLEPHFPPKNKQIVFFKPQLLNYNSMKDEETVKQLCANVWQIVDHHAQRGERGLILAPSFNIVQSVAGTLRGMGGKYEIFEQQKGQPLAEVLHYFKQYDHGPAVLLTPSGFEGVDLPGDLSRFQIVVKAPFGSLGEKRMQHILDVYPDIYSLLALMKIVQGAGRSVRSSDDYAVTYFLDTAIQRLWSSSQNVWKSEFSTTFKSQLSQD
jgi:Rad3-related DNA helicase